MTNVSIAVRGAVAACLLFAAAPSTAATVFGSGAVALGTTIYSQDFDSLATGTATSTVTSGVLPTGWRALETGTNSNATYGVSSGSNTAGNLYSYGAANATDRALGLLRSGTLIPTIGAVFTNSTSSVITDLLIAFTGEQWRSGSTSIDSLSFQYSLVSTNIADALNSAAWTTVNALTFTSPSNAVVGALNGNAAADSALLSATLSNLSIAAGSSFAFRWIDADPVGADDGLAVDNFSVRATVAHVAAVPEPATWAMMLAGFGMIGFALRRRARAGRPAAAA